MDATVQGTATEVRMTRTKAVDKLRIARLVLSGGVFGVAVTGTIMSILGIPEDSLFDLIGAATGCVAVAVVKLIHVV